MKQPIATFCSLALCFWAYQTGLWSMAIPMVVLLEGREFIPWRGKISWSLLRWLHILATILWVLTIVCPPYEIASLQANNSGSPAYTAYIFYFILRGLPIALFPLVLAQTYCSNVGAIYHNFFRLQPQPNSHFSLYYPYFGLCLLSASSTGGNTFIFLVITLGLVTGVLWATRSARFTSTIFYQLILLAMILSLVGTHQFYWLKANFRPPNLAQLGNFVANIKIWKQTKPAPPIPEIFDLEKGVSSIPQFEFPDLPTSNQSPQTQDHSPASQAPHTSSPSGDRSSNDSSPADSEAAFSPGQRSEHLTASGDRPIPTPSSLPKEIQQTGGLVDPQTSQTRIGTLGSLQQSNAILFRIRPLSDHGFPHPLRIQEAIYNQYQSGSWNAVKPTFQALTKIRHQTWDLESRQGSSLKVQVSEILNSKEGLLKVPVGATGISDLDVKTLKENQYGAIAFERNTNSTPLSYTVEFNPSQIWDSPPTRLDTVVPKLEQKAINQVLKSLNIQGKSKQDKVNAISNFFRQDFQYSLDLTPASEDKTPLAAFLLDHRIGHCEYFASATSLLLRSAGIPSRYVVGYSVSEFNSTEQAYIVRLRDAHAWVMAYVNNRWITIDTTPSSGASQDRNGQATVEELVAQRTTSSSPSNQARLSTATSANHQKQGQSKQSSAQNGENPGQAGQTESLERQKQSKIQSDSSQSKESQDKSRSDILYDWIKNFIQKCSNFWNRVKEKFDQLSEAIWFGGIPHSGNCDRDWGRNFHLATLPSSSGSSPLAQTEARFTILRIRDGGGQSFYIPAY